MKVFLHIGIPKTGTTAIQKFLWNNREVLIQKNVIYNPFDGICHHSLTKAFINRDYSSINSIKCDIDKYLYKKYYYVLSSEMFSIRPFHDRFKNAWKHGLLYDYSMSEYEDVTGMYIDSIYRAFKDYDVTVVMFVRRQDDFVESFYRQMIKSYIRIDPINFLEQIYPFINYWANVLLWKRYFPTATVDVCRYETENGGSVSKFLSLLGCTLNYVNKHQENQRLNRDIIAIKYLLNIVADNKFTMNESRDIWKTLSEYSNDNDERIYSLETRQSIMRQCSEGNRLLSKKFFDGVQLFQALPDVVQKERPFPSLNFSEAAPYIMHTLLKYIRKNSENELRIKRLAEFIKNNNLIDENFYRTEYLRGRKEIYSPTEHYVRFGILKGYKTHN